MSFIRRVVGEPLHLRLNLGANDTNKFVRAFLTYNNTPLVPAFTDLIHFGDGLFGDDARLMPNLVHIDVKYKVYLDAGYTQEDPSYQSGFDSYEKEILDPTNFVPPFPQQVFAQFEKASIEAKVESKAELGVFIQDTQIAAKVGQLGSIKAIIKQNEIEGVIND